MSRVSSETNTGGHLWENNSTNVYYGANIWEIVGVVIGVIGLTLAIAKAYFEIRHHCRKGGVKRFHRSRGRHSGVQSYGPWDSMRLRDIERRNRDFEEEGRRITSAIAQLQTQISSINAIQPMATVQANAKGYPPSIMNPKSGYPGNPDVSRLQSGNMNPN